MTQRGPHTWDMIIEYYACPHCGYIHENRERFEDRFGKLVKDFVCERCGKHYQVEKKQKHKFGPLFGEETFLEFDW